MIAPGREGLHNELVRVLGTNHVYYQPPSNIKMNYPCIVYEKDSVFKVYADDGSYFRKNRYKLTFISRKPDMPAVDTVMDMPLTEFVSHFIVDGLHHDVVNVYH